MSAAELHLPDEHRALVVSLREKLKAAHIHVPKLLAVSDASARGGGGEPTLSSSARVRQMQETLPRTLTECDECDVRLVQFLRSRDFGVEEALRFYIEDRVWREQMAVDGILEEELENEEDIARLWPVCFPGHDKFGRPMLFENTGDMDIIQLCEKKKISVEQLMRFHIKQQEYLRALLVEASDRFGKPHDSLFIVMDLEHASLKSHLNKYSRELFSALADVDQNHYPETIGKLILINSSPPVAFAWNFVKPFLNPQTRAKIEFYPKGKQMEMNDIDRQVTMRKASRASRKVEGKIVLPSMSMAGRATAEELKDHEKNEITKTGSWRVRLTELVPRECIPSYLGIRGVGPDPGLLPDSSGSESRLPTHMEPFQTLRFDAPRSPDAPTCAAWRVSGPAPTAASPPSTSAPVETPLPIPIDASDALDDGTDDDTSIESIAAAYSLDGVDVGDFASSRDIFLSAKDWDEVADELIAAEEEFTKNATSSVTGGPDSFAAFLDEKFGRHGGDGKHGNIKRMLSSYFRTKATDVKAAAKPITKPTASIIKGVTENVKNITLHNPVAELVHKINPSATGAGSGRKADESE